MPAETIDIRPPIAFAPGRMERHGDRIEIEMPELLDRRTWYHADAKILLDIESRGRHPVQIRGETHGIAVELMGWFDPTTKTVVLSMANVLWIPPAAPREIDVEKVVADFISVIDWKAFAPKRWVP